MDASSDAAAGGASSFSDQTIGLTLALSSSLFIGSSFVIKKRGLRRAGATGVRAGSGGFSYLLEPLWWLGLATMALGEVANFAAYAFAPAILVTPLGAISIIISAVLAHYLLSEKLNVFGVVGCLLCIAGSLAIVLHAPPERPIASVLQMWGLATQPMFLLYACCALGATLHLIWVVPPEVAASNMLVYIAICSIVGSLSVMSCKAVGIALKLTLEGDNQLVYPQTFCFAAVVVAAVVTQMNYLNRALDLFNTALVAPIYYVMFTSLTVTASLVMMRQRQTAAQLLTEASGFVTIVCGTFLLHTTKDVEVPSGTFMQLLTRGGGGGGSSNGVAALGLSSTRLAAAAAEGGDGLELGVAPPPKAAQRRGASQR
ncbi:putative magnesium transporter NIPA4 [Chlorella vulgaris]